MSKDFNILLPESIANADYDQSWQLVLHQLGKMVVENREDFISLLEISGGLTVPQDVTDAQLIDMFVEAAPHDEDLILGAALAVAHQHQDSYFDGTPKIDNAIAYGTYDTLIEGFGGTELEEEFEEEEQSKRDEAAEAMRKAALIQRQKELEAKKSEQEKLRNIKKQNTIILVSASVIALGIVGYLTFKTKK